LSLGLAGVATELQAVSECLAATLLAVQLFAVLSAGCPLLDVLGLQDAVCLAPADRRPAGVDAVPVLEVAPVYALVVVAWLGGRNNV